jgi:hypothetical protein
LKTRNLTIFDSRHPPPRRIPIDGPRRWVRVAGIAGKVQIPDQAESHPGNVGFDLLFMVPGKSPGSDWRCVMAGGNWDHFQNIDGATGRVLASQGPLAPLAGGETPKWVDAWIVQSSTGSSQTYYGSARDGAFAVANRWIATDQLYSRGRFEAGPAVGIALVHVKNGNKNEYFWWSEDPIELVV